MMAAGMEMDNEFFTLESQDDVFLVRYKAGALRHASDLTGIASFFEAMERLAKSRKARAVVFLAPPERIGGAELVDIYRKALSAKREDYVLQRLFNLVNNYVLLLASMDKITVSAERGRVDAFFFNLSLACDYRLVAENAVYENPCLELGLVSKGGGGFFLSKMLGSKRAAEVMLRTRMVPEEGLRLGLADKIVPCEELEQAAWEAANAFLAKPADALLNVRRLLKGDPAELRKSLELEDLLIMNRVNAPDFQELLRSIPVSEEAVAAC